MAKVFPAELTSGFTGFIVPSERAVYNKLSQELSDDYIVYHDIRWDDPELVGDKCSGQIDFVVIHPDYGFVTIEVKGGRCSYDPDRRLWTTTDRDNQSSTITDPFDQARTAARVLTKILLRSSSLRDTFIPHHHAVIFPDCVLDKCELRGDAHNWQLIDRDRLFDLENSISNLFTEAFLNRKCESCVGHGIVTCLLELFGNRRLEGRLTLSDEIRHITHRVNRLTDAQLEILSMLREQKRMVVQGCAGSGKTTLAIHSARIADGQGKQVLLACFNRPLGQLLARECASHKNIHAGSLCDSVLNWLQNAGIKTDVYDSSEWWNNVLPNLAVSHIDRIPYRFDAIIVDEGQDLHSNWWVLLELLLVDHKESKFLIFMDIHQNIYHGTAEFPMMLSPIILDHNLRNTNQIYAAIAKRCHSVSTMKSSGIEGPAVEWQTYSDDTDMLSKIELILARLISDGLRPADIVILGTKAQHRTCLKHGTRLGPSLLVEHRQKGNELVTMTVHRFKGLESAVVILCEIDDDVRHNCDDLIYVGMSRATAMLFVLYKGGSGFEMRARVGA